jgi:energy-coupling factor transporter ATP-binding protein EcfA2
MSLTADRRSPGSNPFCTRFVRPGGLAYRFVDFEAGRLTPQPRDDHCVESLVANLQSRSLGLIVGPHGSGKSTLLRSLLPVLRLRYDKIHSLQTQSCPESGWAAAMRHRRQTADVVSAAEAELGPGGLLVIDGIEQLSRSTRRRVRRRIRDGGALLATSHRPLGGIPTLYCTRLTPSLVAELTDRLLESSPVGYREAVTAELSRRDLTQLTNLRELWFELYDVIERFDSAARNLAS